MPPNVLLVVLDAARRDAIAPYRAAAATPALAALARSGLAHPRAYAASSWTVPSHAAMFAGALPSALGLDSASATPEGTGAALNAARERWLPEVLRRAGYRTSGFSANLWVSPDAGFDLGFDLFRYLPGSRGERLGGTGRLRPRLAWAAEGLRARDDDGASRIGAALHADISAAGGQPTFWFVNLVEAHSPYLPPRPWQSGGAVERVRTALETQRYLGFEAICRQVAGELRAPLETLERLHRLHERAVAYLDAWVAEILQALDQAHLLEDTLVIVTADHGENFGEDGLVAHGFSLDERLIHVPLLMSGPGVPSAAGAGAFSLAELPALIARSAGLRQHPWQERIAPEGVALAEYEPLGPPEHPRLREFAERYTIDAAGIARLCSAFRAATDGRMKLLWRGFDDAELLYDVAADPLERAPLPDGAYGVERERLAAALARSEAAGGPAAPATAAPPATSAAPGATDADAEERAELERQMRLLGYL